MMEFKASHMYAPISARKARIVMDMVRGMGVNDALEALTTTHRRAAPMIGKVIRSAVANAEQGQATGANELFVKVGFVNEGPLKQGRLRYRPGAQGRMNPYRKRTSHIHVTLGLSQGAAKDKKKQNRA
jgi:large subunit ribosomal protein L22